MKKYTVSRNGPITVFPTADLEVLYLDLIIPQP